MKSRLFPYFIICVGVYLAVFLIEFAIVHFVIQMFTSNTVVSVTAALPMLLFVNPVVCWFVVNRMIKKK